MLQLVKLHSAEFGTVLGLMYKGQLLKVGNLSTIIEYLLEQRKIIRDYYKHLIEVSVFATDNKLANEKAEVLKPIDQLLSHFGVCLEY